MQVKIRFPKGKPVELWPESADYAIVAVVAVSLLLSFLRWL